MKGEVLLVWSEQIKYRIIHVQAREVSTSSFSHIIYVNGRTGVSHRRQGCVLLIKKILKLTGQDFTNFMKVISILLFKGCAKRVSSRKRK